MSNTTNNSNFSSKMKEMQSKYSTNNNTSVPTSKKDANLMVQMNLYDNEKINNSMVELNEIYESQVKRLENLKDNDPKECIDKCNNFLEENKDIIERQLDTVINLEKNIKNVVEECEEIEEQEEQLNKMLKDPEYVNLAEKIKKMRSTVDNLNFFLVKKKISNYKN